MPNQNVIAVFVVFQICIQSVVRYTREAGTSNKLQTHLPLPDM